MSPMIPEKPRWRSRMLRIVIIDDEPGIRRSLRIILTRAGYDAHEAADGLEGEQLCREFAPDLVITDVHMPGADGMQTIAALRAWSPRLPIIVISGGDQIPRLDPPSASGSLGIVSTLRKPFTVAEVLAAISRVLPPRCSQQGG
jgi:CheY-like chemotaxis protein